MSDIEIKRGYEVLPDNNIRFGIKITNISDLAISDVEVILDYMESLFKLEGNRVQKAGVIPPSNTRTIEFVLKPLGCVHKVNIEALISYRDPKYEKHVETMHPKEVHCVCPFLKQKTMSIGEFLELLKSGHRAETGLNFQGVSTDKLVHFLEQTCKNRHYKIDEIDVDGGKVLYLASESIGEKAYYLLTAFIKETDGFTQVLLMAVSDKPHGLNGFLNEMVESLRHVVSTVKSAREIGIIKIEQVINIIDSVVQRTSFDMGGEGGSSINIKGSVVQRTEFNAVDEGKKNREEEERLRKEREEQERIKREREKKERKGQELLRKQKEEEEEQERRKREAEKIKLRQTQEKNTSTNASLPQNRFVSKKETHTDKLEREWHEKLQKDEQKQNDKEGSSGNKFFSMVLILGVLLVGYWIMGMNVNSGTLEVEDDMFPIETEELYEDMDIYGEIVPPEDTYETTTIPKQTYTNSIDMEFVLIPAGEFDMGSPSDEAGRDDEGPVHSVTISNEFYMGKYEVTQKEWQVVMGVNPSYFKGDNLPVESVTWYDVQEFIKKLNEKEETNKYRLPSEAEWEYTARAGTTTSYSFGDGESKLGDYAWYNDNSGDKTHPVGKKKPNPWGMYDMHGNVWEWVQDTWHAEWVQDKWHGNYNSAPTDGSAWEGDGFSTRVARGGSWGGSARCCRSADRNTFGPNSDRYDSLGFRLIQEI